MRDYGDASDFRVLNLGGGECAGVTQVMIGANFFEAAHEREYRNALVFQRKFDEAAQCNLAILRLLGSGVAQLKGGVRQDDLGKLAAQLQQLIPGAIADEFAKAAAALADAEEISGEELAPISAAVDGWTVKVATYAAELDAQLDLNEAVAAWRYRYGWQILGGMDMQQKIDDVVAVLQQAVRDYSPVCFANSLGAEDMVLTDLIAKHKLDIEMFSWIPDACRKQPTT